ncbi:hypothetical protein [Halothermothrix orenii]|uniref:Small, acid-soluble spore protein, alpha/beta type n=1 Tax=Halothermothrix orenii (strain H 168 / OCM 544 / DSM 9562) TaxID=373903 RepID=B8D0I3_HALOH|nr:hypothetical protein [Halothermothrix orenii]ACL70919.1 hypothetical protein Hore_21730 [Halothermothrix orenii H 168]
MSKNKEKNNNTEKLKKINKEINETEINFNQVVSDEVESEKIKRDTARQMGMVSDQVMLNSPAGEYGATGKSQLKNIIKASNKVTEKNKDKDNKE